MEKEFNIKIGGIKESMSELESLEAALESIEKRTEKINKNGGFSVSSKESNKAMDELAKLTQKITHYDEEYAKAVEASKGVLKDKNQAVKEAIELENANIVVDNNIRSSYYDKQKVLSALGKQIKSMNTDTDEQKQKQQELIREYNSLNDELKEIDSSMGNHQREVGNYKGALREATQELKAIQGEMLKLEPYSKEWNELAKKAGEYEDKIGDIRQATRRMASDTKVLDDVINLAQSATAAFELYKGAMSAFGMETEKAEEAMQTMMGAMSIIQSLQTLSTALQESSASATLFGKALKLTGVQLVTNQVNAIKATAANDGLTKAQKAGAIASKTLGLALKAIPLMLVIGLVTTLITRWEDIVGWFQKTFPVLGNLSAKIQGVGKAIVHWLTNPIVSLAKVLKKVFAGDIPGAIAEAKKGIENQFKGTFEAYKKGYSDKILKDTQERTKKETEYELQMLQAKLGNDAKYSKAGIALQKKIFEQRKALAKGNTEELKQIALDETNFNRECQEKKAAAAKKAADERKKAEQAAAAEAKRLAAEAEKKRKEEEKAAEEARKAEEERIKNLDAARKTGADLEIDYTKAVLNEKKRASNETLRLQNEEIKGTESQIKELQKIANNDNLSKKVRKQATDQLTAATAKLKSQEEQRKRTIKEIADLEEDLVNLEKEKNENAVYSQLKQELNNFEMTKEEFYSLINGTSEQLKNFDDTQVQHVRNAATQMKVIAQEAATQIKQIRDSANASSTGSTGTTTSTGGGKDGGAKSWSELNGKEKVNRVAEVAQQLTSSIGNTMSMFWDMAIEETAQKLDEIADLHEKALDKVNASGEKIKELNEKLRDSSTMNKEAIQQQLADEQLVYAQRLAEEQKLKEEETNLKNQMAQQEAKARKMELGIQLVMGISNTALGITQALKAYPPPLSFIMAGLVGAMGAVQTALIAKQMSQIKPVKYAEGGIINGKSHSQGGARIEGTNIEVEGGEMVVSKKNTERFRDVLYKINRNDPSVRYLQGNTNKVYRTTTVEYADTKIRKFATGGTINFESVDTNLRQNSSTAKLMGAINDINMQPVVSVKDIWKVEDRLVRVRGLAGR